MEKIYMNNDNNNNKKKQSVVSQVLKAPMSKKLSVSMVLVAFFSFLAIGVSNVSYAAPEPITEDLGNSFTTASVGTEIFGEGGSTVFPVFMYSTITGIPVFCLERNVPFQANKTFQKSEQITDQGLLYVMANTYPHKVFKTATGTEFPKEVQTWITQAAVWDYLFTIGASQNTANASEIANMKAAHKLYWETSDGSNKFCDINGCYDLEGQAVSTVPFYTAYVSPIVEAAKKATGMDANFEVRKANEEISITEDEKYYQSSLITATNSSPDNFVGYSVTVDGPKGTILVDESGNEIKNLENMSVDRFYIRVPVNQVTEESKSVRVSATAKFRGYDGYYYKSEGAQTISSVFTAEVPVSKGVELALNYTPEVPDTSMTVAQSVYFIGLIVLLCGVGIIYANARPKQTEQ